MAGQHHHSHWLVGSKLRTAFVLTVVILFVEVAGGLISNSLALLADAGHVLTDLVALGLAWFATAQAERSANATKTYGYHRTGILIALVNAVTLILIVLAIGYEAVQRFQHPEEVTPWLMFVSAAVGIILNLYIGMGLRAEGKDNLNVRAAMLHVFGDVLASAGVIVGGLVILLSQWYLADPLISLGIAIMIAKGAWDILRETLDILMEAVPKDLNIAQMVRDMMQFPVVKDVHDLHVWSLAGGMPILTAHVQVADDCTMSFCETLLGQLNHTLQQKYGIAHTTLQFECAGCVPNDLYCTLPSRGRTEHKHASGHDNPQDGLDVHRQRERSA